MDAPFVLMMLTGIGAFWTIVALALAFVFRLPVWAAPAAVIALWLMLTAASFAYTTRRGKFVVWAEILEDMRLRGNERILDMGSGRGAIQLMAAQLVPSGEVVGLDLWRSADQSGNTMDAARKNAAAEGVADQARFETGDMAAMPFADATFDVVISSLAIHNIEDAMGRRKAIDEAARVLKPGGRMAIADFQATEAYAARLRDLHMERVTRRNLGWRFWYGGPWTATWLVTATKA